MCNNYRLGNLRRYFQFSPILKNMNQSSVPQLFTLLLRDSNWLSTMRDLYIFYPFFICGLYCKAELLIFHDYFFATINRTDTASFLLFCCTYYITGVSSLGVPRVPWHTQILTDQLTLFQPRGTDYAHLFTTGTPGFSDLPTALDTCCSTKL